MISQKYRRYNTKKMNHENHQCLITNCIKNQGLTSIGQLGRCAKLSPDVVGLAPPHGAPMPRSPARGSF